MTTASMVTWVSSFGSPLQPDVRLRGPSYIYQVKVGSAVHSTEYSLETCWWGLNSALARAPHKPLVSAKI